MMIKRAFMIFALLLLSVILVTACGPEATQEPAQPPADSDEPAAAAEMTVPSVEDGYAGPPLTTEPITLKILRPDNGPDEDTLRHQWQEEFTAAHPNITFEEEVVPFSQLAEKIQTSVSSGDPADIIFYDGPYTKAYAYYDILRPVSEYMTEEYKNDYVAATLAEHSYQGEIYGMPLRQSSIVMFYNQDMTDAAGISPPVGIDEGWSWDEALASWQKLQQDPSGEGTPTVWGLAPSMYGAGGPGFYYLEGIFMRGMGDKDAPMDSSAYKTFAAISEDGTQASGYVNTPEAIEGMEWFQKMFQEWKITPLVGIPGAFLDGKAATSLGDDWTLGDLANREDGFNWGVTPIPAFNTRLTHTGSDSVGVSAASEFPAEAAAYLIYIHNTENLMKYWDLSRGMPARVSLYEELPLYAERPYSLFFEEVTEVGTPRPSTPGWQEFEVIMNTAIRDIGLGGEVETILNQAAENIDAQLAKYKDN